MRAQGDNEIVSTEKCTICDDSIVKKLPCDCKVCEECLFSWTASNNFRDLFSFTHIFNCPNHKCNKDLPLSWILANLSLINRNCILEILKNKFLNTPSSFKKCPNEYCEYVGWLNSATKCSQPLECELCKMKWVDPSLLKFPIIHKITQFIEQIKEIFISDLLEMKDKLLYKPCQHCGFKYYTLVTENYDPCTSCSKYICKMCSSDHMDENKLSFIYCKYKSIFLVFGAIMLSYFSIIKLFLSLYFLREFTKWLIYLVVINTSGGLVIYASSTLGYYALYDFISRRLFYEREPHIIQKIICFILFSILVYTVFSFYMKFETFYVASNYLIIEACIALPCLYFYYKYKGRHRPELFS